MCNLLLNPCVVNLIIFVLYIEYHLDFFLLKSGSTNDWHIRMLKHGHLIGSCGIIFLAYNIFLRWCQKIGMGTIVILEL